MADTGAVLVGAGANDASLGFGAWLNTGNVTAEDGTSSTISVTSTQTTNLVYGTNNGTLSVPGTATIDGIKIEFKVKATTSGSTLRDNNVWAYKAGARVGANQANNTLITTTLTWISFGGPTSLFGTTWTPAEINAVGFGGGIGFLGLGSDTANVDAIRITVYYTNAMSLDLTLSSLPKKSSMEWTIQQGYEISPSLSTLSPVSPSFALAPPMTIGLELSTLPFPAAFPFEATAGTSINLSLSNPHHQNFSFDLATVLNLSLSVLPKISSFTNALTWGTQVSLSLSTTKPAISPTLALTYGTTLVLPSLSNLPKKASGILYAYSPVVTATKYVQAHRSGVTQIIYGVETGLPFLLNKAAMNYRRRGKMQLIHTGKVKPNVAEIDAVFTVLTPTGRLEPNDFLYEAPGGYLRIRNPNVIDVMMTQDGDTPAIHVVPTKVDITQGVFFTSFHQ